MMYQMMNVIVGGNLTVAISLLANMVKYKIKE